MKELLYREIDRVIDLELFILVPRFIFARIVPPMQREDFDNAGMPQLSERIAETICRGNIMPAIRCLRERGVDQQWALEVCSFVHEIDRSSITASDIVAGFPSHYRAGTWEHDPHVRCVLAIVPTGAELTR